MSRKSMPVIFYIIVALAVIGLLANVFTNPAGLFSNIFMILGVGVAIFAVVYFLFLRPQRTKNDGMKKYKLALKQSNQKYKTPQKQQVRPTKNKHKRVSHLRVIEGNKSKRKNRAN